MLTGQIKSRIRTYAREIAVLFDLYDLLVFFDHSPLYFCSAVRETDNFQLPGYAEMKIMRRVEPEQLIYVMRFAVHCNKPFSKT